MSLRPANADTTPFASTSFRFHHTASTTPGVGEYRGEMVNSIQQSTENAAAVGRAGVFGSRATRFPAPHPGGPVSSAPGPADYSPASSQRTGSKAETS
ncbi:MAG: hypothetical protein WDW38_011475, partial [Sanguina aurantia]